MKPNTKFEDNFSEQTHLGEGGFSEVVKVRYKKDNKYYALKKIKTTWSKATDIQKTNIEKEFEYLKSLDHSNIVSVVDDFLIEDQPAILMEFVDGKSLYDLIEENGYFSTRDVVDIAKQISAGLMICHNFQIPQRMLGLYSETHILTNYAIIHNDISTKNIIQVKSETGETFYKLIDFGLAFVNPKTARTSLKRNGMMEFKSPEKWKEETVGTQSDIYSLGVVLYTLLTGQPPFSCDDYSSPEKELALKNSCLYDQVPSIWEKRKSKIQEKIFSAPANPDFPYWLNLLVLKCLEKDPNNRYRSGKDLNEEILKGSKGDLQDEWPKNQNEPTPSNKIKHDTIKLFVNSNRKYLTIIFSIFLVAVLGLWITSKLNSKDKISYSDNIELIKAYFECDEKALNEKSINKLVKFFQFPISYYSKKMNQDDFANFYIGSVNKYKKKSIEIDSIVPVINMQLTGFNSYEIYGKIKLYYANSKVYKPRQIKDKITISDGKIVKVEKMAY